MLWCRLWDFRMFATVIHCRSTNSLRKSTSLCRSVLLFVFPKSGIRTIRAHVEDAWLFGTIIGSIDYRCTEGLLNFLGFENKIHRPRVNSPLDRESVRVMRLIPSIACLLANPRVLRCRSLLSSSLSLSLSLHRDMLQISVSIGLLVGASRYCRVLAECIKFVLKVSHCQIFDWLLLAEGIPQFRSGT